MCIRSRLSCCATPISLDDSLKAQKNGLTFFFFLPPLYFVFFASQPHKLMSWRPSNAGPRELQQDRRTYPQRGGAHAPLLFFFFWKLIHQPVCFIFLSKKKSEAHLSPSQMIPHHHRYNIREKNLLEGQVGN